MKAFADNKISDWFKFKVFADDNKIVNEKLNFDFGRMENIVGKGEIAHYVQFLPFPVFLRLILQTCKNRACLEKGLALSMTKFQTSQKK